MFIERLYARCAFVVSAVALIVALVSGVSTSRLVIWGQVADATVVRIEELRDSDHQTSYSPRLRFETDEGRTVEFRSRLAASYPKYRVGEEFLVLYDPDEPTHAEIYTFWSLWCLTIVASIVGLGLGAAGIAVQAQARSRQPRRRHQTDVLQNEKS
jgi:hypothetical protein